MSVDIKKLKQGSEEEFEKFYNNYINRIYTVIYRVVENEADAEELALEVMMKVYDKIQTFREDSKLSSWVYRIAYNHGISHLRKKKVNRKPIEEVKNTIEDKRDRHLDYLEQEERDKYVKEKLMELPEKYRTALTLYHFEDLSYKEIADIMDTKMGTVKTYIYRGRQELKEIFEDTAEEVK